MRIYILPVNEAVQPKLPDYGLEQDFLKYLQEHGDLVTTNRHEADYHFLPVFWGRLFHGKLWKTEQLQTLVTGAILDETKTFTIVQSSHGTVSQLGKTLVFQGSRLAKQIRDLPLLLPAHSIPERQFAKKYRASFVGQFDTHPLREEMAKCFQDLPETLIIDGRKGTEFFVATILESYITLSPRGAAGSSFRFFESMQLGTVPLMIGDVDARPFKQYLPWNEVSFYTPSPREAVEIVRKTPKDTLLAMGAKGARVWEEHLTYGKWCPYVIRELTDLL